jgi:glycosyltransferase involved in cell wall biosynthesis
MDAVVSGSLEVVDVIIPVYNGENTIAKAIESVKTQTNSNISKIIVVNDGSTDATVSIIRSLNLPNVELITTINLGVASARNTGISASKSEWVAFLDADDYWLSDKLEKQLSIARHHDISFICSAANLNGKKTEGKISFLSLWKGNFIATSSVLMTREHANKIYPLFSSNMTFAEDYASWFKILTFYSGYFTSEALTRYDVSPKPHYQLGATLRNFIILQKECILFLLMSKIPVYKIITGSIVLISGTSISIFSVIKRFMQSKAEHHWYTRD